jgi:phage-related protein
MAKEWRIDFYREGLRNPVEDFLSSLDEKTYARFTWSLEQLRHRNISAREPLVRHVEGKVWELREESRTNIYRVLYFAAAGRRFVMLHGFQKKTQRTPRREIDIALDRQKRFEAREGRAHG